MTFIAVARSHKPENPARSLVNARTALAEIQHGLMNSSKCGLNEDEIVFLKQRCTEIEAALATFWTSN